MAEQYLPPTDLNTATGGSEEVEVATTGKGTERWPRELRH